MPASEHTLGVPARGSHKSDGPHDCPRWRPARARLTVALACVASLVACSERKADPGSSPASPQGAAQSPPPERAAVAAPVDVTACDGVLVIALDAAPAEVFSFLGGSHPTTPRLAALAREGVVVTDHVLASTGLNAGIASLLTGLHPREHGVGSVQTSGRARLRTELRTLAEGFLERGWRTLFAAGAPQLNPYLSGFGTADAGGFQAIHVAALSQPARRADQVVGDCLPTLTRWAEAQEPFFALVELSDLDARGDRVAPGEHGGRWLEAHLAPLASSNAKVADALAKAKRSPEAALADLAQLLQRARGSDATLAWRRALRDGRASALDAEVGRLLDMLAGTGRLERTLVVIVGVRGGVLEPPESSAGPRFLPEVVRTPLIIRFPRRDAATPLPRGERAALASLVDVPRALDGLFRLGLAPTDYPTTDLVACAERAPLAEPAKLAPEVAYLTSADLSLSAVLTRTMQLERSAGGEDFIFHRSGRMFSLGEPPPQLPRVDRERFERFAHPATCEVWAAEDVSSPLEVGWRIEQGLLASVVVDGLASEDLTSSRETARRRSGRARIGAGGALRLGLTERTADVRLDFFFADARPARDDFALEAPLSQSLAPRIMVQRVVAWPADDSDEAELPLADVQRTVGTTWRFAVNVDGPCEALITVWPPRATFDRLDVSAGGRVIAEQVPGRADVVRLTGNGPFDVTLQKRPDEQFAFAIKGREGVLDPRRIRVEGRRMASESELSIVVPGWLPGVTGGLYGLDGAPAEGGSAPAGARWRALRFDPAGLFGPDQALTPDVVDLVRSLPAGE
ncbi:MAG: sulfatase-like hydrolase/transferase [Planctomycetota bacterium]